jgi:hypothetical protein
MAGLLLRSNNLLNDKKSSFVRTYSSTPWKTTYLYLEPGKEAEGTDVKNSINFLSWLYTTLHLLSKIIVAPFSAL